LDIIHFFDSDLFPVPTRPASSLKLKLFACRLEPTTGIEPVNLFLTKEALYLLSYVGAGGQTVLFPFHLLPVTSRSAAAIWLERETRLELATFSLEG
jgi:hypothetical protein